MADYVENLLTMGDDQIGTLEAGEFLLDSGLLFEINRRILHPLGLAILAVRNDDTGKYELSDTMIDARHIRGGLLYDDYTVMVAEDNLFNFMEEFGVGKMQERQNCRKFIVQKSLEPRRTDCF